MGQLRAALLLIESALPTGALDTSEVWTPERATGWEWSVRHSLDPQTMMEAVLMLEDSIDPDW